MPRFKVIAGQYLRKVLYIEAQNEREAHDRAWDAYHNTEFLFDPVDDIDNTEFYVQSEENDDEPGVDIESKPKGW